MQSVLCCFHGKQVTIYRRDPRRNACAASLKMCSGIAISWISHGHRIAFETS